MKFAVAIIFALSCTFITSAQKMIPNGYQEAHALSITGDFDGDGKPDTLSQFVTDSLGRRADSIVVLNDDDHPIALYDRYGYRSATTLNGRLTNLVSGVDIYLYCLINLGNINKTKGDEIALVSSNLDYSAMSHCSIYSYCNGRWVAVFAFNVTENAFDYDGDTAPVFTTIPGALEKHNGRWMYLDYNEVLTGDNPKMKPVKAANCK